MAKFKVIIVGGSVAGLTLAHTLDSAGINYVLLEARDTIAPPLGATMVIQANGARIMDQLGLMESLAEDGGMAKMASNTTRMSDGRIVGFNEWPRLIELRLGYTPGIFERQRFLQALYNQLKHRDKVHVSKKVTSIEDRTSFVEVNCEDGSSYTGDIVVGADGINSRVRKEMQRLAPPELVLKDKESITAEYVCFFGVSDPIPSLKEGDLHTVYDIDRSALLFVGSGKVPQWFFITKMDKKYSGDEIPRFTKDDMEKQVSRFGHFQFCEGITLQQLMDTTKQLSYLPLEEAHHEVWTHRRIVCLGDSIHKMTPNFGQGGNQAIEGAAVMTNCLRNMLQGVHGDVTLDEIETALLKYQKQRQERAKRFIDLSGLITRVEAMATLTYTLRFLYFPLPSSESLADRQTEMYSMAPILEHLPIPARLGAYKLWGQQSQKQKASVRAQWVASIPIFDKKLTCRL